MNCEIDYRPMQHPHFVCRSPGPQHMGQNPITDWVEKTGVTKLVIVPVATIGAAMIFDTLRKRRPQRKRKS